MSKREWGEGRFIAIEGLDGAGTTTQAAKLRDWLAGRGHQVHLTQEPSRGPLGVTLRQFLEGRLSLPDAEAGGRPLGPAALALLFAADRLDHIATEILPATRSGRIVVSDRYLLSSLAYQAVDCDPEFVSAINALAPAPDLSVLLDVPAEVCRKRIDASRAHLELFEELQKLERVAENYRALSDAPDGRSVNTVVINGDRPPEVVHEDVKKRVERILAHPAE